MNSLLLIGGIIFLGTLAGKISQKFKIPQVIGYIIIGILLGKSVLGLVGSQTIETFNPLINFTLGVIGFVIGAELKKDVFTKYGKTIYAMLLGEGLLSFFLVFLTVTLVTKQVYLGLLLGAIASATDPASTVNVLWEYKTRGPLTTTLISIVALDDALALILYSLVSVASKAMIMGEKFSLGTSLGGPLFEIFQCVVLGTIAGIIMAKIIIWVREKEIMVSFVFAEIAAVVGLSIFLNLDLILSTLIMGITVVNLIPKISEKAFKSIREFSAPLYVFFFVAVGLKLDIHVFLKLSMVLIIVAYLLGRSFGKIFGAMLCGYASKAKKVVSKYIGFCLFTQGGVAIGLAMSISHNLSSVSEEGKQVGLIVVSVVAATTFVVQLIGPFLVKFCVTKADEVGRNITKNDIVEAYSVADVMQKDMSIIRENDTLEKVMLTVKQRDSYHFPVTNSKNELSGLISLGELRNAFEEEALRPIVLAKDVALPLGKVLYQDQPLKEAFEIFDLREIDFLPVIQSKENKTVVGILEYQILVKEINKNLLDRQQGLDKEESAA